MTSNSVLLAQVIAIIGLTIFLGPTILYVFSCRKMRLPAAEKTTALFFAFLIPFILMVMTGFHPLRSIRVLLEPKHVSLEELDLYGGCVYGKNKEDKKIEVTKVGGKHGVIHEDGSVEWFEEKVENLSVSVSCWTEMNKETGVLDIECEIKNETEFTVKETTIHIMFNDPKDNMYIINEDYVSHTKVPPHTKVWITTNFSMDKSWKGVDGISCFMKSCVTE